MPQVDMSAGRAQANQGMGKVPKSISAFLLETVGKHCREWPSGKKESEIKLLMQENNKPQDLIVYTGGSVTKDLSG